MKYKYSEYSFYKAPIVIQIQFNSENLKHIIKNSLFKNKGW